ncbi:MAG TPA: RNA-binding cell elongation regulator Jag/EloR [Deltaproteobacteria bacterium]|nr:RNA-binding cell elongation regulator Jag/EloR [Deltaproteobacteria bacterium]HOI05791.1 RNA-binding cell elongation regulator Jag/EloR [Deltaproteobacteria bacterium]
MEEDYREFEAKSVDEAIVAAMKTFRLDFESLDIQVVSEGSKGLFGIGTKSAKILARPARKGEPAAARPATPPAAPRERHEHRDRDHHREPREHRKEAREEPLPPRAAEEPDREPVPVPREILEEAQKIVKDILALMNMPAEVRIKEDHVVEVVGDGSGLLIGKRGATIDSLQFIVNRILNKDREEPVYVTIDTEGYRKRHVDHLRSMAMKMSQKVRRTGQSVSLEKMNPYDRRIIHLALKNDSRVNTKSIGEGVYKKVVILPRKSSRS